jgi:hypothetical protein
MVLLPMNQRAEDLMMGRAVGKFRRSSSEIRGIIPVSTAFLALPIEAVLMPR